MLVPHTPRSSFEQPAPTTFFSLPAEIRNQIYELVLADLTPQPLVIRYHFALGWLIRYPWKPRSQAKDLRSRPQPLQLLFLCKQIYNEASDLLYNTGPTLSISEQPLADADVWHRLARLNGYNWRPVRQTLPAILKYARQTLNIQVKIPYDCDGFAYQASLLRWVRAAWNERRQWHGGVTRVNVDMQGLRWDKVPHTETDYCWALRGWKGAEMDVTFSVDDRKRPMTFEGGGAGGSGDRSMSIVKLESEKVAWKACVEVCKRREREQVETVARMLKNWWYLR
jgi:hypothetical protein